MTEQQALEKLNDRMWRLSHLYKIKTKDRKLITLKPNFAQLSYLSNETHRDIILKARQLGFSTLKLIELLDFAIWNKNANCAMIAHKKEKVQVLFEIARLAFEHLPGIVKPKVSYDNRNELYFPEINSKIYVATDTRGETVHNLHVSELAYLERAEEKMLGILESVPRDGHISFESTANGISGYFYDIWESDNEFKKHFFSWTIDNDYRENTSESWEQLIERYIPLQLQYGLIPEIWSKLKLDKEQFNWYIKKVVRHRHNVVQEYPSTPIEAFISTGRNVFSISDLQEQEIKSPISRKYQDLLVWESPLPNFRYVIGCDPSEGIGLDDSVIEVFNANTGEQVAEMASPFLPPDVLGDYLVEIARWYNNSFVVLEINNHGYAVALRIKRRYANLYRRETFDKVSNEKTERIGWKTTLLTKPVLVGALEESLRTGDIKVHSQKLISQMKTFVRTEEQNKKGFGAEGDRKDDTVIASGLAVQGMMSLPRKLNIKSVSQRKLEEYIAGNKLSKYFDNNKESVIVNSRRAQNYKIRGHSSNKIK